MKTTICVAVACLLLSSCAANPNRVPKHIIETSDGKTIATDRDFVTSKGKNTSDKDEVLVCRAERVVGSHIPKYVCLSQAERDEVRENSQQTWHKAGKCATGSGGGGGGLGGAEARGGC